MATYKSCIPHTPPAHTLDDFARKITNNQGEVEVTVGVREVLMCGESGEREMTVCVLRGDARFLPSSMIFLLCAL